jgi:hypothetical protein
MTDAPSGGASFSATMSPAADASASAGPLTVVRLLRIELLLLALFADRDDLAIDGESCRRT